MNTNKEQLEIEEERKITITDKDGKEIEGLILFAFEENGDEYVVYEIDENGEATAYAAKVDEDGQLKEINEDEWPLVEKIFNEWLEEQEKESAEDSCECEGECTCEDN